MKRIVIITQSVDERSDVLGFFVAWIRALAHRVDHVDVITLAKGAYSLPSNVSVYSLGKEQGVSKLVQIFRYLVLTARLIPGSRAVLAHMSPIFAITAWPWTLFSKTKLLLWYLHRSVTTRLRLALFLSDALITADARSLRITSSKIVSVGHGISIPDVPRARDEHEGLHIISVARITPLKRINRIIEASLQLMREGISHTLRVVGSPMMPSDEQYARGIHARAQHAAHIEWAGSVPHNEIAAHYAWADIAVNLAPRGGLDKAVLEAMAYGVLPITTNHIFHDDFGPYAHLLLLDESLPQHAVAERIKQILALSASEREEMRDYLMRRVRERHSVLGVTARILTCVGL